MSFGETGRSDLLEAAVDYAYNSGTVLVAAAGNNGTNGPEMYPAAYKNVIAVAATDQNDARATWDNTDTKDVVEGSNAGSWVDVAAPGKGIYSTTPTYPSANNCDGKPCYVQGYDYKDGTSMAAPHVSGLAALLLSRNASLSPTQVRNQIEYTAKDLGTAGKDNEFGHGRIDARYALDFVSSVRQETDRSITYSAGDWMR